MRRSSNGSPLWVEPAERWNVGAGVITHDESEQTESKSHSGLTWLAEAPGSEEQSK